MKDRDPVMLAFLLFVGLAFAIIVVLGVLQYKGVVEPHVITRDKRIDALENRVMELEKK